MIPVLRSRQSLRISHRQVCLFCEICACVTLIAMSASAQLASNQTHGFGNNRLVTFTHLQNFDCSISPCWIWISTECWHNPIPTRCKSRFARWSRNLPRTRLEAGSNTPHTSTVCPDVLSGQRPKPE